MAGPTFAANRLLGAPGVPRLLGTLIRSVASRNPPRRRRRISGQPRNQRTLARMVVFPAGAAVNATRTWFGLTSPRELARTRNERVLLKPLFSREDLSWLPRATHPVKPVSKVPLAIRLPLPTGNTS